GRPARGRRRRARKGRAPAAEPLDGHDHARTLDSDPRGEQSWLAAGGRGQVWAPEKGCPSRERRPAAMRFARRLRSADSEAIPARRTRPHLPAMRPVGPLAGTAPRPSWFQRGSQLTPIQATQQLLGHLTILRYLAPLPWHASPYAGAERDS